MEEIKNSTNFIQVIGSGTVTEATCTATSNGVPVFWKWIDCSQLIEPVKDELVKKEVKKMNPYVPESIYVNEAEKIVVVKWADGTEIKVTCDSDDVFNVDAGFAQALKYKLFDGKTEYKEKWWKIIQRRIKYHDNKEAHKITDMLYYVNNVGKDTVKNKKSKG